MEVDDLVLLAIIVPLFFLYIIIISIIPITELSIKLDVTGLIQFYRAVSFYKYLQTKDPIQNIFITMDYRYKDFTIFFNLYRSMLTVVEWNDLLRKGIMELNVQNPTTKYMELIFHGAELYYSRKLIEGGYLTTGVHIEKTKKEAFPVFEHYKRITRILVGKI